MEPSWALKQMIESRYKFIPEENIVFIERKGTFVAGDLFANILSIVSEEGYRKGMHFLVDARGMDTSPASENNIRAFKNDWQVIENIIGATKIAIIHKNSASTEISQLSPKIFYSDNIQRCSFYNFSDALDWLGIHDNVVLPFVYNAA